MMKRGYDLVGEYYGRMKVNRRLGIDQVPDKLADGKRKYFPVMNSETTNRDEGNEMIRERRNQ